jgi:hypothetical protein
MIQKLLDDVVLLLLLSPFVLLYEDVVQQAVDIVVG